jgi:hypothetical protein
MDLYTTYTLGIASETTVWCSLLIKGAAKNVTLLDIDGIVAASEFFSCGICTKIGTCSYFVTNK